jgi:hypothetical protein
MVEELQASTKLYLARAAGLLPSQGTNQSRQVTADVARIRPSLSVPREAR